MMETSRKSVFKHGTAVLLFLAVAALCGSRPLEASDDPLLSLQQAVTLASQQNRELQIATLNTGKAKEVTQEARTHYFPVLNFSAYASQQLSPIEFLFEQGIFGQINGQDVPDHDVRISTPMVPTGLVQAEIDQPISQLYKIKLSVKAAKKGEEVSAQDARLTLQNLVQQVKLAYWNVALAQSGIRSLEENIKLYKEMDRVTQDYLAQETVLKADALQVKAQLAQTEYNLQCLRDTMLSAKESLNLLLGRDPLEAFSVEETPAPTAFETDLEAARRQALAQRAEPAKAKALLEQAELDRRAKKAEYIPDLGVSLQYMRLINYSEMLPKQTCGLGLLFKWEVYDWGRKKHELREKDQTIAQAKLGLKESTDGVVVDVNDKFRKLRQNRLLLESVGLAKETAVERLRVVSDRYKQEAALVKDVLQAQSDLEAANSQYRNAVISFWTARAEFEKAMGEEK